MRIASYVAPPGGRPRAAIMHSVDGADVVVDVALLWTELRRRAHPFARHAPASIVPTDLVTFLATVPDAATWLRELGAALPDVDCSTADERDPPFCYPLGLVRLCAPVPRPPSVRDFYAFEEHVRNARRRRGLDMVPEWYELPVFYFSNPASIYGPEDVVPYPRATSALDFELEVAAVIAGSARDLAPEDAETHILGYTIMNDWSARDVQRKEMAVGLGPAKGKDFATTLGPWIVTPDELAERGADGRYDAEMMADVNGRPYSRGNWRDIHWSFAEMVAFAARDACLSPGDVVGSGTVGTGCILEIGPTEYGWLAPGDVVELRIDGIGTLRSTVGQPRSSSG